MDKKVNKLQFGLNVSSGFCDVFMEDKMGEKNHSALHKTNEESNRLTKQCIETAMLKLLKKKSINDITITELVKVAGVSRNAYYRNYDSKDEIVSEICRGITQNSLDIS